MASIVYLEDRFSLANEPTVVRVQQDNQHQLEEAEEEENDLGILVARVRFKFVCKIYFQVAQFLAMTAIALFGFVMAIRFAGTDKIFPKIIQLMMATRFADLIMAGAITFAVFLVVTLLGYCIKVIIGLFLFAFFFDHFCSSQLDLTRLLDESWILFILLISMPIGSCCVTMATLYRGVVLAWCTFVILNISLVSTLTILLIQMPFYLIFCSI